ncbi:hypothetical protein MRB53_040121 [Persea americana]|nr:hypothetical protein MRB53_040121 [Persea americana]
MSFGQESVAQALKEVEAYTLFSDSEGGEHIIHAVDHEVKDEGAKASGIGAAEDGAQKTVYILLPYYRNGNLQDLINKNLVEGTRMSERTLLRVMLGVCRALRAMHRFAVPGAGGANGAARQAKGVRAQAAREDADLTRQAKGKAPARGTTATATATAQHDADNADADAAPLMPATTGGEITASLAGSKPGTVQAYAHRDIKPANIMLDDSSQPILMDLGSIAPSPTPITNRSVALQVQDTAAEHSTMPYRAPELFDVKTGTAIDTKVDIWSLGCTMYACLVGKSPFEARSDETGGSLSICVLGGDWRWPDEGAVKPVRQGTIKSEAELNGDTGGGGTGNGKAKATEKMYPCEEVREVVRRCLAVEPAERPDVDELIELIQRVMDQLPGGVD